MGRVRVRYLVARQRRGAVAYYWIPTRRLIGAGFAITRLPADKLEAAAAAERLNAELDRWYAEGARHTGPAEGTLAALDQQFQAHRQFTGLRARTQRDYLYAIRFALEWIGPERVDQITRRAILAWVDVQLGAAGPSNARHRGAALRRLLQFGRDQGWIQATPADRLNLPALPSRHRVWTLAERDAFCAAAEGAGHPSMALAVMLGWCLGQRPADLRTLAWTAYDGASVALRQGKTGQAIRIPALPELRRALEATERRAVQIVVSEATGRPYRESAFQHEFARIRRAAGLPTDLQFRDLRRTLATALGAAGCTDDQIRAITGHRTREVVAVYVRPDSTFADAAMERLQRGTNGRELNACGGPRVERG